MKTHPQNPARWMRPILVAFILIAALFTGLRDASAAVFNNYDIWKRNGFHGFNGGRGLNTGDGWDAVQSTGANLIRWFVAIRKVSGTNTFQISPDAYGSVDQMLSQAASRNMKIVVVFNPGPTTFWLDRSQQNSIVAAISAFAARYAGNSVLAGLDIMNEPRPSSIAATQQDAAWADFAGRIIQGIRAQDPTRVVVFEWARCCKAFQNLQPLPYDGIVYSIHWYMPHALTHQGISDTYKSMVLPYPIPSTSPYGPYYRILMKQDLQPVRDFQVRYDVPIYIGEFSCARWAPGTSAYSYVINAASIFDDFGWNWTYYVFRGYEGWDAELAHGIPGEGRSMNTDLMRWLRWDLGRLNY